MVTFRAQSTESSDILKTNFRKNLEDTLGFTELLFDAKELANQIGPNTTVNNFPRFIVDMNKDRKPDSKFYGATLTTLLTGYFETVELSKGIKKMRRWLV